MPPSPSKRPAAPRGGPARPQPLARRSRPSAGRRFDELRRILDVLRGPGGCPWDRAQDVRSIVDYFLEEAFEAAEACLSGDPAAAREELGDMLMEIVFLSRLFEEKGLFDLAEVVEGINEKMVRRHPHVFGKPSLRGSSTAEKGKRLRTPGEVVDEWQRGKLQEKARSSVLQDLPRNLPALLTAFQIGQRAGSVGFDWPDAGEALGKVREEVDELAAEVPGGRRRRVAEEVGDLLFALVNVSRHLKVNPELALRAANRKFARRFARVEATLKRRGRSPRESSLAEMDAIWDEVKKAR